MGKIISKCVGCDTECEHPEWRPFKYCTNKCQGEHKVKLGFGTAASGALTTTGIMKNYLMSVDRRCSRCNATHHLGFEIPLDLEHTDGNHANTTLSNCKLLCPTCHALTPTYKNRNKGNGRAARRQRYQDGKSY
ncbi:hypothetical protein D3C72_1264940 [compost metagenome]